MEIKTYRAKSLQEALRWIRSDLGPEAAVLHTREVRAGWLGWLSGPRLEVTAGLGVHVPSRFPAENQPDTGSEDGIQEASESTDSYASADGLVPADDPAWGIRGNREASDAGEFGKAAASFRDALRREAAAPAETPARRRGPHGSAVPRADEQDFRIQYRQELSGSGGREAPSLVEDLCERSANGSESGAGRGTGDPLVRLFADLTDEEMDDESARELVQRLRDRSSTADLTDPIRLRLRLMRMIEEEIQCAGPLQLTDGKQRVVAFVGPTGVGKTTTLAKLAAEFHVRQQRRVGLVTIDTYRVAAVDQLRTYADIIDLPLEVVATSGEMRSALARLADRELVLVDTAGHSPTDDRKMKELQTLLEECQADEVQLVVSGVASLSSLKHAITRFAALGATRFVVTKLDEMPGLGHLWPVLRRGRLPLSYVTDGQNVPDDLAPAEARKLARQLVKMDGGR